MRIDIGPQLALGNPAEAPVEQTTTPLHNQKGGFMLKLWRRKSRFNYERMLVPNFWYVKPDGTKEDRSKGRQLPACRIETIVNHLEHVHGRALFSYHLEAEDIIAFHLEGSTAVLSSRAASLLPSSSHVLAVYSRSQHKLYSVTPFLEPETWEEIVFAHGIAMALGARGIHI